MQPSVKTQQGSLANLHRFAIPPTAVPPDWSMLTVQTKQSFQMKSDLVSSTSHTVNTPVAISLLRQTAVLNMPGDAYVMGSCLFPAAASHILLQPRFLLAHMLPTPPIVGGSVLVVPCSDHDHHLFTQLMRNQFSCCG